jgi:hypothetical protein
MPVSPAKSLPETFAAATIYFSRMLLEGDKEDHAK